MALTAVPVGFVAGLFGIGGGLITVPFLYYIFGQIGINQQYIMHLAVGTSFAIIIPTSIVSVLTHHKFNAVDFNVVKGYGVFVIIGVILGTILAAGLKTKPLILFFSVVVYILTTFRDFCIRLCQICLLISFIFVEKVKVYDRSNLWTSLQSHTCHVDFVLCVF